MDFLENYTAFTSEKVTSKFYTAWYGGVQRIQYCIENHYQMLVDSSLLANTEHYKAI